uniref:NADH-ubiquinone oxidoreductase chain 4L n=1 Tax=Takobia yixiani TaxID=743459 RepID=X1W3E5_9INSE|nr:NADH dehydrogenase subunit 4L [Takobia yixiani]
MMKLLTSSAIMVSVLMGLWSFAKLRSHIISSLLSLEFASLSVYLLLFKFITEAPSETYVSLVYLTLAACEGALGLSILVTLIKHKGNDYLSSPNLTQC